MVRFFLSISIALLGQESVKADTNFDGFGALVEKEAGNPTTIVNYSPANDEYQLLKFNIQTLEQILKTNQTGLAQNSYFKIVPFRVLQESTESSPTILDEEPLPLTDLDARNVLYHMMRAREFFKKLDPANSALEQPITIRVQSNRKYNSESHAGTAEDYNFSVHFKKQREGLWGQEIWFAQRKGSLRITKRRVVSAILGGLSYIWSGPVGLISIPAHLLMGYWSGVDMAKQPSEVYHEAYHWASNAPNLLPAGRYSHPLSENLANYFGTSIEGKPELRGLRSFTDHRVVVNYRNLKQVRPGKPDLEYDYTSFVPTFLWAFRLQNILTPKETDRLAWTITQRAGRTSFPSDIIRIIQESLGSHPNFSRVEQLIETYECSFYNMNERFTFYYEVINGLKLPERPPRCETGQKI